MSYTIQYIEKIPSGIRLSSEYECESLEDAEQQAVSLTSGDAVDANWQPINYEVAIIRRNGNVLLRYFHTMEIP
ncbi:MAG TPA: hypothetical protein VIG47_08055 [Gemmatimonadaceae bacterium]